MRHRVKRKRKLNDLKAARHILDLTQDELAEVLDMKSTDRIIAWERGDRYPGMINLLKLEAIFRTTIGSIYHKERNELLPGIQERLKIVYERKRKSREPP